MIKIIDNFLDDGTLNYLNWSLSRLNYELNSSTRVDLENPAHFFKSVGQFPDNLIFQYVAETKINTLPFLNICSYLRAYVNIHTMGDLYSGRFHKDDGKITALFYPQYWEGSNSGGTEFEDGTIVEYKQNRIVFFDANIKHRALDFVSNHPFRYTLAYKMDAYWQPED